ncbi:flagellar M-ring protein FliF [Kordiimonas sp. SCSIO 12603]|uniref:flagellar basal-body MS-ring/collar protein FliF n=1 Tax=Kordiimonas sp. SCSIO 12603 TaxID=2829596 RepID=UPI0021045836|nr:flagellar basal-body MS-ring/collar protein FliF [Kordiimonas sp. SCSIO 12603]UTW58082.1 flagellar M-ring protein FliF [Kordiimonas sp. SCSIO 12603]
MDGLIQTLKNMGMTRLAMIGVAGTLTVAFFWAVMSGVSSSPMVILYADLDPASASSIAAQLEAENIPISSDPTGRTIKVPRAHVDRLRLRFAGEGLTGGVVGKEIFDADSGFGRTSFELNVNYVRAIEGELARTIKYFPSVREARVHVVIPERRPFQREESQPSASIMLKTAGSVSQSQAQAIQALVASAVPSLSPDYVTITDTSGRLLVDGGGSDDLASFSNLDESRRAKEREYRSKIEELIGSVVGVGRVRAEVAIQMNMSRTTTSETSFDPEGQVVISSNVREESSSEPLPGGQVTVGNNQPNAANGSQNNNSADTNKTEEATNFENSKTETVTVREPGEITGIQVSVLVDYNRQLDELGNTVGDPTPRDQTEIDQIRNLVITAIPAIRDAATGDIIPHDDNVTVAAMRFVDPEPFEATAPSFNLLGLNKSDLLELVTYGGTILVALVFLLLIVRPLVIRIIDSIPEQPTPEELAQQQQLEDMASETPAIAGPGGITGPISADLVAAAAAGDENAAAAVMAARQTGQLALDEMRTDSQIDMAQIENRIQETAIQKVSDIIKANPAESVAIIRGWLYAE